MTGQQFPRMPWYPRDFASSTRGWPLVARGVYRELLDAQWDMGHLPTDQKELRAIARATSREWRKAWPFIEQKFVLYADGFLRNLRLEKHRKEALSKYEKQSRGARETNEKRWRIR